MDDAPANYGAVCAADSAVDPLETMGTEMDGAAAGPVLAVRQPPEAHTELPGGVTPAQVIEALLFASDAPLTAARLSAVIGLTINEVRLIIAELNDKYMLAGLSFRVEGIARGYQMLTLPVFNNWLAQLEKQRNQTRLSGAGLEVLSIVAYKQPITRADIEVIRGVACGDVMSRLRDMNLIKTVGRAEVIGHPLLYGTTRKFLEIFGLQDLEDLPPLEALPVRKAAAATIAVNTPPVLTEPEARAVAGA